MTFTVRAQLGSAEGPEEHKVSVAPYSSCLATAERFIGLSAGLSFGEELYYSAQRSFLAKGSSQETTQR